MPPMTPRYQVRFRGLLRIGKLSFICMNYVQTILLLRRLKNCKLNHLQDYNYYKNLTKISVCCASPLVFYQKI